MEPVSREKNSYLGHCSLNHGGDFSIAGLCLDWERERESHYDAIQGLTIKLGADNFHLHFCVCQARQTSYIWNI